MTRMEHTCIGTMYSNSEEGKPRQWLRIAKGTLLICKLTLSLDYIIHIVRRLFCMEVYNNCTYILSLFLHFYNVNSLHETRFTNNDRMK